MVSANAERHRARAFVLLTAMAALALALMIPPSVSAQTTNSAKASFSAHGSAEQVYVTGLAPPAPASLIDAAGHTVFMSTDTG